MKKKLTAAQGLWGGYEGLENSQDGPRGITSKRL